MRITTDLLDSLRKGFSKRFQDAFAAQSPNYEQFATVIPSSTKTNVHGFMDRIPKMREWIGERVIKNFAERSFEIENKKFELTMGVKRDDIEDDNLGTYAPLFDLMGQQARMYPDDLVLDLIESGTSRECYDGQYFFDTDHPKNMDDAGAGTQSNNFTSRALSHDNLQHVRTQMRKLVGADGRPLGVNPTHLVVPPALEKTALQILNAEMVAEGGVSVTNVLRGSLKLIVWDRLTSDTAWYLLDLSKPIKPFVFQNRSAPEFQYLTEGKDENVFMRDEYVYGIRARGNAGYALWFLAARAVA